MAAGKPVRGSDHAAPTSLIVRIVIVLTVVLGLNYLAWRWLFSLNGDAWWIAVPLVIAETYSFIDVSLFGLTVWRRRSRPRPPAAAAGLSVDVFITTYNEPVGLVEETARAAQDIRYPHTTWILDDGERDEMRAIAESMGVGYITRGEAWRGRPLHAKAGNLNNALMSTTGEFLLILDADQVAHPEILHNTLGYFEDPELALVQTPQVFGNVPTEDPLGSQAPLFYGPIQQGKDGWNAAFFCGSNAILRREALMQLGIVRYVADVERAVTQALKGSSRILAAAHRSNRTNDQDVKGALTQVSAALTAMRAAVAQGEPLASVTYALQRRVDEISRDLVARDLELMARDIEDITGTRVDPDDEQDWFGDPDSHARNLAARQLSPLAAFEAVQSLLRSVDVGRSYEAQPVMPLATISVTEDMATSMRLHGLGWKSAYHHETLAIGLAPEDLGTAMKQRLRWAQGTMQVMLRENPLVQRGLTMPQRLMYFSTMWSYLSGFAAIAYFVAPVVFLCFGILPVDTTALEFFLRFLPFMIASQLLFAAVGRGIPTWRGQQYSLALFPIWIHAATTAFVSVVLRRPLGFVVTEKTRQTSGQWRLIRLQVIVAVILAVAGVIGVVRLAVGLGEPIGTLVNLAWVAFDLVILGVLVPAVLYKGYQPKESVS